MATIETSPLESTWFQPLAAKAALTAALIRSTSRASFVLTCAHARLGNWYCGGPGVSLLSPVAGRHVGLGFRGRLTDPLFVARLGHLAAAWVAFVEQLRKEVAVPVFVEDQFALRRCGVGLCLLDFEESGS